MEYSSLQKTVTVFSFLPLVSDLEAFYGTRVTPVFIVRVCFTRAKETNRGAMDQTVPLTSLVLRAVAVWVPVSAMLDDLYEECTRHNRCGLTSISAEK